MKNICSFVKNNIKKVGTVLSAAFALVIATSIPSYAEGAGTADASVVTAITGMIGNVAATIAAIGALALGIYGVFVGWKFAKKIFKTVAN